MSTSPATKRRQRASHLMWLEIGQLRPHPRAQREYRPHRAEQLAADFNLEGMGFIVVSKHGSDYFIIDGQHRVAALKIVGFADTDAVQCEVYDGLSDEADAELFLERNTYLNVAALDKFRTAVVAGRADETAVAACVRAQGLTIGGSGGIKAVASLMDAYRRTGADGLGKTLRILRDSYGERGFESAVIGGASLAVQRYNGKLDEDQAVKGLSTAVGGLNGLLNTAAKTRETLGQSKAQCIAATMVSFYNRAGGKRLPGWWKDSQ